MNLNMVWRLILKDWYLERWLIAGSLVTGGATLAWIAMGGKLAWLMGLILIVTILIGIGAQLAMASIVNERSDQTLAFVMSLPISYREFTASKIFGSLLIFLVPWVSLAAASLIVVSSSKTVSHGLVPYVAIMAGEILASTCMVTATAVITESKAFTIAAIMVGNLALNGIGYWVAHMPGISAGMDGARIVWTATARGLLVGEFGLIVLLLSATFYLQSRKRDFL